MCFRNYWFRKTCLDKCLKIILSEDPLTRHMENGPNTVKIFITAPLSYLLITVKTISSKKSLLPIHKF